MNTLRSIVWPQEVVERAKVLQEKKSASAFWKTKLIFIHDKNRQQRSKYTSKSFDIKKGHKSKNVAIEILK